MCEEKREKICLIETGNAVNSIAINQFSNEKQANFILFNLCFGCCTPSIYKDNGSERQPGAISLFHLPISSTANSKTINLLYKGRTKIQGHYILSKSESYKN